ncbi:glycine cleavage system protein R [Luteithermobacter gelatinilyticus]|uniref:glycine cleavage system protein R n=1 Tax=Luteithermobacter gelatinilyticus TaxID=2582913 RepID=UPI0011074519|nr:ACT domain-containing protein [Luteithermobacter gelatinilyticus]|tara:strand:- start:4039 stop:4581 length:543 start_codon:yes stop_codon:yes gene_type:complete
MSKAPYTTVLISIVSPDQVGLIAAVAGRLFELGVNLADTSFAQLGEGCEFSCVAEIPLELSSRQLQQELQSLDCLGNADVLVTDFRFSTDKNEGCEVTHIIDVSGGDQPGLVARLAEAFIDYDANVVHMHSTRRSAPEGKGTYHTTFAISVDKAREEACLAAIYNTASQLQLTCRHETVQ